MTTSHDDVQENDVEVWSREKRVMTTKEKNTLQPPEGLNRLKAGNQRCAAGILAQRNLQS